MASLIEDVVLLEQEADALVAAAHAEAKDLEKRAEAELRARQGAIDAEAVARIDAYRTQANARLQEELQAAERDAEAAAAALRKLDAAEIARQAERVVARFREI